MKKIIIVPNSARDENFLVTKTAIGYFSGKCEVYMDEKYSEPLYSDFAGNVKFREGGKLYTDGADAVVVLGGDGTILSAVSQMLPRALPVFGVNLGHLGFLAEIESDDLKKYADRIIKGEYKIDERMMIEAKIIRNGEEKGIFYGLNDIVIARGALSRILHVGISVGEFELDSFDSDGVIFSTPTGSTAYSLSAGGPVISPEVEAILVTAISPHNMSTRPVVLPSNKIVRAAAYNCGESRAYLSADGRHGLNLEDGDVVEIKKSEFVTKLIKFKDAGFYESVKTKLNNRGRR